MFCERHENKSLHIIEYMKCNKKHRQTTQTFARALFALQWRNYHKRVLIRSAPIWRAEQARRDDSAPDISFRISWKFSSETTWTDCKDSVASQIIFYDNRIEGVNMHSCGACIHTCRPAYARRYCCHCCFLFFNPSNNCGKEKVSWKLHDCSSRPDYGRIK